MREAMRSIKGGTGTVGPTDLDFLMPTPPALLH